jgi:hypothetical protein
MATVRKTMFFGIDSEDSNYHTHKISFTGQSIIIADADDDFNVNAIEVSIQDWKDICQFILEEKRWYDFIVNYKK